MNQRNLLAQPGDVELKGVAVDLRRTEVPCCFLSTKDDHIAPWQSTYRGSLHFGGPVRFVLGGSAHIAGVINPPDSAEYGYWAKVGRTGDPDRWLAWATLHGASWWTD